MSKGKHKCTISNTLPQVGACMSPAPSLLHMHLILGYLRDLVKMFSSWSFKLIKLVVS